MEKTYHVYIGWDDREPEAYEVAELSLRKNSSVPLVIHKLHHKELRQRGLFRREWRVDSSGQYYDIQENRPFSVQFSFTRFLVPELWRQDTDQSKSNLALFFDCDFLVVGDVGELFKQIENSEDKKAVWVVPHDYQPKNTVKMDNIIQTAYNKKLWSAMMVFDMNSLSCQDLSPDKVNSWLGKDLHNFNWVVSGEQLGMLGHEWQWVENSSEPFCTTPKIIHYTEGGPWFDNYKNCAFAEEWNKYRDEVIRNKMLSVTIRDSYKMWKNTLDI